MYVRIGNTLILLSNKILKSECFFLEARSEGSEETTLMAGISSHLWTSGPANTDDEQVETDLTGS